MLQSQVGSSDTLRLIISSTDIPKLRSSYTCLTVVQSIDRTIGKHDSKSTKLRPSPSVKMKIAHTDHANVVNHHGDAFIVDRRIPIKIASELLVQISQISRSER